MGNISDEVSCIHYSASQMNRLGCLRLTERCANILLSVREEIHEAGDQVGSELALPISKLEESVLGLFISCHP